MANEFPLTVGSVGLMLKPNTYVKRPAPTFGARIASGDPDYNNLSIWQHWVQRDWIGGAGAKEWTDDSMFDRGYGIEVGHKGHLALSREIVSDDLLYDYSNGGAGSGWVESSYNAEWSSADGTKPVGGWHFFSYRSHLCAWGNLQYYGSNLVTGTGSAWQSMIVVGVQAENGTWYWSEKSGEAHCAAVFEGHVYLGAQNDAANIISENTYGLVDFYTYSETYHRFNWAICDAPTAALEKTPKSVKAIKVFNGKLYVAFENEVCRASKPKVYSGGVWHFPVWDGSTVFYTARQSTGLDMIVSMEIHLGKLYMLSSEGHLHQTDGANASYDLWDWDGQVEAGTMRTYDGRLFISMFEYGADSAFGSAVLYQFTGTSITELRRWSSSIYSYRIRTMVVWNKRLYIGASGILGMDHTGMAGDHGNYQEYQTPGWGVAIYDSAEDSHSVWAYINGIDSGENTSREVGDLFVFGGKMYCAVMNSGTFSINLTDIAVDGGLDIMTKTHGPQGVVVSSFYDGGTPGMFKMWRSCTVYAEMPAWDSGEGLSTCGFNIWYRTTTKEDWIFLGAGESPSVDGRYVFSMTSPATYAGASPRVSDALITPGIQYCIQLWTDDSYLTPIIRSVVFSYLAKPVGNWLWSFSVILPDYLYNDAGEIMTMDVQGTIDTLEGYFLNQNLLDFTDVDGHYYGIHTGDPVLMYDYTLVRYDPHNEANQSNEAEVRITLIGTYDGAALPVAD